MKAARIMMMSAAVCLSLFNGATARASTLSTNYAEVTVDNLKLGEAYNLTETANFPMWVSYRGDAPVELRFGVLIPAESELKSGYEPIPDASWISLSRKDIALLPDESGTVDVTINIPNDEKYLGKKYQAYIHTLSLRPKDAPGGLTVSLALKGRILFGIAQKPPTEAELRDIRRRRARAAQSVTISPERFAVSLTGPEAEITEDAPLKIINSTSEKASITVEQAEPAENGIPVPRGYKSGAPGDISVDRRRFSIRGDSIENIRVFLKTKGGETEKLFYILKVSVRSSNLEISRFVRIYVN